MILRGLVLVCPLTPPRYGGIFSFDGGAEGMVLRGLVLLCPLPHSRCCCIPSFRRWSGGYGPTGSVTVLPPPSLLILLYPLVLTVGWRVWSYGVWFCFAPSLPLDTNVFPPLDGGVEGMVLRGLVLLCPLPPS